jgi:hypothetical protein
MQLTLPLQPLQTGPCEGAVRVVIDHHPHRIDTATALVRQDQ